ncbi:MAG: hypothetical protein V3S02_04640, partial [Dehalococcoidales bacterium]
MKKKISKILGVAITITMLASLMIVAAPASAADPLVWNGEFGPGGVPTYTRNAGSNMVDFAIGFDGLTIYAVAGGSDNFTYKSADGGNTWSKLTTNFGFAPVTVAVAPDDVDMVVVANTSGAVYLSTNGGISFSNLNQSIVTNIFALAISPASSALHYIVAAGDDGASNSAISYFNFGATLPVWTNAQSGTGWTGTDPVGATAIRAVAFSPAFASDKVMLIVSENSTTKALLEVASFAFTAWNTEAGFSGYPATILAETGIGPLNSATLDLAPTYLGADEAERLVFVGLATPSGTYPGGAYRFNNTTKVTLLTTVAAIRSVAFDGTNLVAGAYASNWVYRS